MSKLLPKYAHSPGRTNLAYSPDSRYLFSVGADRLIRKFSVGSTDEPDTIEHHDGDILAVATSKTHFATCSEDGTVSVFDIKTNEYKGLVTRSSLPFRDLAFSPDGEHIVVGGDDDSSGVVKVINIGNILDAFELEAGGAVGGVKHVCYDPTGRYISASCGDGVVRVFDLKTKQLEYSFKDIVPSLKSLGEETSTRLTFHPDGRYFAFPTKSFDIGIYSGLRGDITPAKRLEGAHKGPITDFKWSPNGLYICSAGPSGQLIIWDVESGEAVVNHTVSNAILFVDWHPSANVLSFTTDQGQLYTLTAAVPTDYPLPYGKIQSFFWADGHVDSTRPDPEEVDEADEYDMGGDLEDRLERTGSTSHQNRVRSVTADPELNGGAEDWIIDDDGAGYVTQQSKRISEYHVTDDSSKRARLVSEKLPVQGPFQTGSTAWNNDRRYLCMNFIGYVWTVRQEDGYNTITVSFFDRDLHRESHFTDHNQFDLASLSEQACLFASTESNKVFLRFHDGYTDNWEYLADKDDKIRAVSLSETLVVIVTEKGYVQTFNIYGTPLRVYRQVRNPAIACSSWKDFFMIVRVNTGDGSLSYTIEDGKTDQSYQKDDYLDIDVGDPLKAVFFSEDGDPCIFDREGVLLVLLHWRDPMQAKWVPVASSKQLREDRAEQYWPLGLSSDAKFHCIVLKGEEKYPRIPLPITSEFDLNVPMNTAEAIEQQYLTQGVLYELAKDRVSANNDKNGVIMLSRKELELDKLILRLLQTSCREGKHSKSVGLVGLLKKEQALEAAAKIAVRLEMSSLAEKIEQIREERLSLAV